MNKTISHPKRLTLQKLFTAFDHLRERIEDLEDARDLKEAIRKNGKKSLTPWEKAKKELGLE